MEPSTLKAIGTGLSALGALLLAFRIKGIVDVMVNAIRVHDLNDRNLSEMLAGGPQRFPMVFGMDEQVEKKQKRGVILLVTGFSFIALGNILNIISILMQS